MVPKTRIKICGMTQKMEVIHAVSAGVDALGFIFVKKSPRYIDPESAREVVAAIPPFVDAVGVFMDEDPDLVKEIAQYSNLTMLQLHGSESPEYCQNFHTRVLKAFRVHSGIDPEVLTPYHDVVSGYLLDTYHKDMGGGTGETFDWSLVDTLQIRKPFVLAGGLTVENVGDAIRQVRPFAVDVNSGIEIEPGRKDTALISKLVTEVEVADQMIRG